MTDNKKRLEILERKFSLSDWKAKEQAIFTFQDGHTEQLYGYQAFSHALDDEIIAVYGGDESPIIQLIKVMLEGGTNED